MLHLPRTTFLSSLSPGALLPLTNQSASHCRKLFENASSREVESMAEAKIWRRRCRPSFLSSLLRSVSKLPRASEPGNNMEITSGSLDGRGSAFESRDLRYARYLPIDSKPQDQPKKRRESTSRFSFIDLSTMESLFRAKVNFQARIKSLTSRSFYSAVTVVISTLLSHSSDKWNRKFRHVRLIEDLGK